MLLGAVLAVVQTDVKRMLAYSAVAHTGFLLTGVIGVQGAGDLAEGQYSSLEGVLFYLTTYGFAIGRRVRAGHGRPRRRRRGHGHARPGPASASARRWSPGRSRSSCSRWPGIPLTVRLRRQVGGLHLGDVGRRSGGWCWSRSRRASSRSTSTSATSG